MGDARKDIEIGNEKLPYFYNNLSVRFLLKIDAIPFLD